MAIVVRPVPPLPPTTATMPTPVAPATAEALGICSPRGAGFVAGGESDIVGILARSLGTRTGGDLIRRSGLMATFRMCECGFRSTSLGRQRRDHVPLRELPERGYPPTPRVAPRCIRDAAHPNRCLPSMRPCLSTTSGRLEFQAGRATSGARILGSFAAIWQPDAKSLKPPYFLT